MITAWKLVNQVNMLVVNNMIFKIGDKVKSKFYGNTGEIGEIVDVSEGGSWVIKGFTAGSSAKTPGFYLYSGDFLEKVEEPKVSLEIEYEEPTEDEMDDNCVVTCRPGEHKCARNKV